MLLGACPVQPGMRTSRPGAPETLLMQAARWIRPAGFRWTCFNYNVRELVALRPQPHDRRTLKHWLRSFICRPFPAIEYR